MNLSINIVGTGVVGLCAARALLDRGAKITLYERGNGLGKHACSWLAGGMLAPFCEGETADPLIVSMGQESADWWQKHTNIVTKNGTLVLALNRDKADLKQFSRRTRNHNIINKDEISDLEPDLADRFNQALFFKDEAHLSPRHAMKILLDGLIRDGATFICDDVVPKALAKDNLTLDCRGFAAKHNWTDLRGVKGEMLVISCPDINLSRPIRLLHPRIPLYIVPRGDGIYMLGATMIESSARNRITVRSTLEMLSAAYALNPIFGEAEVIETGVDSRPAFPDNLPRIIKNGNLIQLNGLYRHGFLLAPAMARMVSDLISDQPKLELSYEYSA